MNFDVHLNLWGTLTEIGRKEGPQCFDRGRGGYLRGDFASSCQILTRRPQVWNPRFGSTIAAHCLFSLCRFIIRYTRKVLRTWRQAKGRETNPTACTWSVPRQRSRRLLMTAYDFVSKQFSLARHGASFTVSAGRNRGCSIRNTALSACAFTECLSKQIIINNQPCSKLQ